MYIYIFFKFYFFVFLGLYPRHMEVPRLEVESELQLWAYTTATATLDPSCTVSATCTTAHGNGILNALSKPGIKPVCVLTDTSQIHFH